MGIFFRVARCLRCLAGVAGNFGGGGGHFCHGGGHLFGFPTLTCGEVIHFGCAARHIVRFADHVLTNFRDTANDVLQATDKLIEVATQLLELWHAEIFHACGQIGVATGKGANRFIKHFQRSHNAAVNKDGKHTDDERNNDGKKRDSGKGGLQRIVSGVLHLHHDGVNVIGVKNGTDHQIPLRDKNGVT